MAGPDATLVVGPAWVGDMIMAQALYKTLKQAAPDAPIDVVAPPWSAALVERMDEVRTAHVLSVGHGEVGLGARRALGRRLREGGYGRAIVTPRSFKAALVPYFARVPVRTGFRGEFRYGLLNDVRRLDKARLPTTVSRYVALALPPDASLPPIPRPTLRHDPARAAELRDALDLAGERPVAALLPGAEYGPAKQWPAEHFAALAKRLDAAGFAVWVLGSAKEAALGAAICAGTNARNLCGETSLTDAIDLLHEAQVAVSNDSGLMHMAAACDCRVVAIYGSSSPRMTPPLTERAHVVREPQPCSPCFARTCRFGHYDCLKKIDVERVAAAAIST